MRQASERARIRSQPQTAGGTNLLWIKATPELWGPVCGRASTSHCCSDTPPLDTRAQTAVEEGGRGGAGLQSSWRRTESIIRKRRSRVHGSSVRREGERQGGDWGRKWVSEAGWERLGRGEVHKSVARWRSLTSPLRICARPGNQSTGGETPRTGSSSLDLSIPSSPPPALPPPYCTAPQVCPRGCGPGLFVQNSVPLASRATSAGGSLASHSM